MTTEHILDALRTAGLDAHLGALESLIQPTIRIVATPLAARASQWRQTPDGPTVDPDKAAALDAALAALPIGASRFGGVPDLPPGVAWPERDGVPMEFIAQIRLDDVSGLEPDGRLPPAGTLLFFYNTQWTTSDQDPDAACCAVIFHEGEDLVRATPPQVEYQSEFSDQPQVAPTVHGLARLHFEATQMLPRGQSPYVPEDLRGTLQDAWANHHDQLTDPGPANHLLGYMGGDDYVEAHRGPDDQLLLQVDSDDAAGFHFGDVDSIKFVLTRDELAARDFSKVRLYQELG